MGLKRALICEYSRRVLYPKVDNKDDLANPLFPYACPPAAQSSPPPQRKRSNVSSDHVKNKVERFCWMVGV